MAYLQALAFPSSVVMLAFFKIPSFLIAVGVHEFAHAKTAELLGDDTPRFLGRVTLNPFAHLDLLGLISLLLIGIGWARPVPYDPRNFRSPVVGSILTALAGPLANLFVAMAALGGEVILAAASHGAGAGFIGVLRLFLSILAMFNILLAVFNLLPIPPLDGGHLIMDPLAARYPRAAASILRWSPLILLLLLVASPRIFAAVSMASSTVYAAMRTVWRIFVAALI